MQLPTMGEGRPVDLVVTMSLSTLAALDDLPSISPATAR